MAEKDYTYAVARIRCRENRLMSSKTVDQLIAQKDYQSALRFLSEQGFSIVEGGRDVLSGELERLWSLMKELVGDLSCFDVFRVQNDYHNIKVSVKSVYSDADPNPMLISNGTVPPEQIYQAVSQREYNTLPEPLAAVAAEAMTTLLKTNDGQLCDIIIDKACLDAVYSIGERNENEYIRLYSELLVASSDIKIAVRCERTGKTRDFMLRCMARCSSVDIDRLADAALKGFDEICSVLSATDYRDAVPQLKKSMSAFEKWCDDRLTEAMKSQKSEPFTIGPLVAYIIAKFNEIKTARLVLSAKLNGLSESVISERIREMYV